MSELRSRIFDAVRAEDLERLKIDPEKFYEDTPPPSQSEQDVDGKNPS